VYNRRALDQVAGRFISQARRRKNPLSFLMIDADNFKEVNTRFGHLTGDFVLAELAGVLKSSIRGSDAVVRYGGDEFLMFLADTDATGAQTVLQRIRGKLDDWNSLANIDDFQVSVSIGVAEWHDGETLDEMLDRADRKMYEQKDKLRSDVTKG
jgi:diguanylate cyclase (GGDEF)-like protein